MKIPHHYKFTGYSEKLARRRAKNNYSIMPFLSKERRNEIYIEWLSEKENTYAEIGKRHGLTEHQVAFIVNAEFKNRKM